jgi:hypothetical protein
VPITLRLTREGSTIRSEYSTDGGESFHLVGEPLQFDKPLPGTLYVGLASTAHDTSQVSEARFKELVLRTFQ